MALKPQYEFLKLGNKPPHQTKVTLEGKWVLITGATSGIGLSATHRFAKGKANLILFVRNEKKVLELKKELERKYGIQVRYYLADFSILKSVKEALQSIVTQEKQIDVLINNAGVYSTKRVLTKDQTELVLTVNHLSSLLITETLTPLLSQSKGRIIQVNSEGHRFSRFSLEDPHFKKRWYTGLRSYGASKSAQLHTVWALAPNLFRKGITINAMHPGAVQSEIGLNNGWLYRMFKKLIINRMLKSVENSAEALYFLAAEPSIQHIHGHYYYLTHPTMPAKHALKSKISTKILNFSLKLINKF
jgi:short-subunit dehydrogenase